MRGELDWIVMKALEKDRNRRYETANGLAADLRRYLDDEPVQACPPSAWYRFRKLARKYRTAFVTVAAFAALLAAGSVVSAVLMLRALSAERMASRRLNDLRRANAATIEAQVEARAEADKAKAVNEFLTEDLLTQAEPANTAAEDHISLLEVLDRAAAKVGDRFAGQPEVEDALRRTIAGTYHGLASWEKAEQQWRAVLAAARRGSGPESPETLTALSELAHILRHRGRIDAEMLEMAKSASEGLARVLGPDHPDTLSSRNNLALAYSAAGRTAEAITLQQANRKLEESKLGPDHPSTLDSRNNLAFAYQSAGRTAEAITMGEATLKLQESKLGPDHPSTLTTRNNLGSAYFAAGRTAEAITLFEATLKLRESKLGPDHPSTLTSRNNLALAYSHADRIDLAIKMDEATLKLCESKLGTDHPSTLTSRNNLALAYRSAGRTAEAITMGEATLKLQESKLGPDHPSTLTSRNNLALAYYDAGRTAEAITMGEATLKLQESKLGPDRPETLTSRNNLALAYQSAGRTDEAIKMFEATLKRQESKLGPDHPDTLRTMSNFGRAYRVAGRLTDALTLLAGALKRRQAKLGPDHPDTLQTMNNLAGAYLDANRWADAERTVRECLGLREKKQPDAWATYDTKSVLGAALLGQKNYAGAEPLLLAGYQGLKQREAKISAPNQFRLVQALERLVQLYQAMGKQDKANEWQKKLAEANAPAKPAAKP